jgi:hypothetical protein
MKQEKYLKIGAVLVIVLAVYLIGIPSLSDDMGDMMIQLIGLVLIFASSMLIALESSKASYLDVLKSKYAYETKRIENSIKGSFRIVFTEQAKALKTRKQAVTLEIDKLKRTKVTL